MSKWQMFFYHKLSWLLGCGLILFFGLVAYHNSWHGEFQFDDVGFVMNNPHIRDLSDWHQIWLALKVPARFVTFLSFALNYHFHQLDVTGYHIVNFIIHCLNALLVVVVLMMALRFEKFSQNLKPQVIRFAPWLAGVIFVIHPLQTQAVSYITQRFASMATVFYLLTLFCYLRGRMPSSTKPKLWLLGAGVTMVLGFLSKETTATIPLMLILWEVMVVRSTFSLSAIRYTKMLWFVVIFLGAFLMIPAMYDLDLKRILLQTNVSHSHIGDTHTAWTYFLSQMRVIWIYLRLSVFPIGQNLDYDMRVSPSIFHGPTLFGLLGLVTLTVVIWKRRHQQRWLTMSWLWVMTCLLVESSFIPIRHIIFEHRMYLPLVGICWAMSMGLLQNIKKTVYVVISVGLMVGTLTSLTVQRNHVWQTEMAMWQDVMKKSPNKSRPYLNLGIAYMRQGNFEKALALLNQALERNPTDAKIYHNRGLAHKRLGLISLALADYEKAIELKPGYIEALNNRGVLFHSIRNSQAALRDLTRVININALYPEAYNNRGLVYQHLKEYQKALADFEKTLEIDPYYAVGMLNAGHMHYQLKSYDQALVFLEKARAIDSDLKGLQNNLGLVYLALKKYDQAAKCFEIALTQNPNDRNALNNLGLVHFQWKQYDEAIKNFRRVVNMDPSYQRGWLNLAIVWETIGDQEQALIVYQRALKSLPTDVTLLYKKAKALFTLEQWALAIEAYTNVLAVTPNNLTVYIERGRSYQNLNQLKLALKDFESSLAIWPDFAEGYWYRGQCLMAMRQPVEGRKALDKAVALGFKSKSPF